MMDLWNTWWLTLHLGHETCWYYLNLSVVLNSAYLVWLQTAVEMYSELLLQLHFMSCSKFESSQPSPKCWLWCTCLSLPYLYSQAFTHVLLGRHVVVWEILARFLLIMFLTFPRYFYELVIDANIEYLISGFRLCPFCDDQDSLYFASFFSFSFQTPAIPSALVSLVLYYDYFSLKFYKL